VISADVIARDLTNHEEAVKGEIRKVFGEGMYDGDGSLRRRELADIVFRDHGLRKRLDGIVHPRVFAAIDGVIAGLNHRDRTPYILVEAALIYETGMNERLDYTIVVDAPEDVRISRVMTRDGCARDEVLARIRSQMPVETKLKMADFVLKNDEDEVKLASRVGFLDSLLRRMVAE